MFETSVIRAEVIGERRFGLMSVSFAFHGLVVISILAASIRTVEFPTRAPNEYAIPIFAMPVSIPPALGTPNGGHKQAAAPATAKQKPLIPTPNMAPNTMPDHAEPVAATTTGETSTSNDSTGSDQPKGVPWGVKEGVGDGPPTTSTASVEPDAPLLVIGDVKAPVVIHRVTPPYPRTAITIRLNGYAIVECVIDKTGHVRDARVVRSSSPLFDQAAVDAVLQWQFAPGSLHGKAVDTIFDLTVTFRVSS
jgi:TonB family C-terminal domain